MSQTKIISMIVNVTDINLVTKQIITWSKDRTSAYVCVSNVHMCMETFDNEEFKVIVNQSDLTVPDGRPIFWAQKLLGHPTARQVRGTDLTLELCKLSSNNNIPVGFIGGKEETLKVLKNRLKAKYKNKNINYSFSPPFRDLHNDEKLEIINNINDSKIKILFVGLGCPKQEKWMAKNKKNLNCVMIGVGAAFDFIAGNKKNAPKRIQSIGLEWFFRLISEPKRLWKRYLKHNPRFIWYIILQLLGKKYE